MNYIKSAFLLILLKLLTVNSQLTLSCFFDDLIYKTELTTAVSETQIGACKESYAFLSDSTKYIVLTFSNIVVNCANGNSNLRLISSNNTYTYCGTTTDTTIVFVGKKNSYVAVQKFGVISFTLQIQFVTDYNPCANSPCLNGGTCVSLNSTSYTCSCSATHYGINCQREVPNAVCIYDNQLYVVDSNILVSQQDQTMCSESYVYSTDASKSIVLDFVNVNIDCTSTSNNLRIISDDHDYTFCGNSTSNNFTYFSTKSRYVAIRKIGIVSLSFNIQFTSNYVQNCGKPMIQPSLTTTRIVGGVTSVKNSWPWQVYITDNQYLCGASLINSQWIITAAHCSMRLSTLYAYLGDHNIRTSDGETRVKVTQFIPHPYYAFNNGFDVALMKLEYSVASTDKIVPVCLPGNRVTSVNDKGIVTGWGLTQENGAVSSTLNQVSVTILADSLCGSNPVTDLCAGETFPVIHDSCQGDSGGPLVIKDTTENVWYLAGIVSRGVGCRGKGVYAKVSQFQTWIYETIAAN